MKNDKNKSGKSGVSLQKTNYVSVENKMSAFGAFFVELPRRLRRNKAKLSATAMYALATCALGTSTLVAVAASPTCSQLVHSYVDRLERNFVTADTLKRWHDWGVGHPNWHPALHARRPKYKKVRQQVATNEPIACPVFHPAPGGDIALLDEHLDLFLLPVDSPDLENFVFTPANPTEASLLPPAIFPGGGVGPVGGGGLPNGTSGPVVVPPVTTPPDTPVPMPVPIVSPEPIPEPNSIILTMTGMVALGGLAFCQKKNAFVRQS